ncbi:MAG TPA: ABC transporter substrate-binding protein [Stellaceae bacterium]|nr:ABC transporter substrate-binding protein [Stellaceae bacterium]
MYRRGLLRVMRACFVCICAWDLVAAAAPRIAFAASSPEDRIRSFYETLLSTMRDGTTLGARGRYDQLGPAIQRDFDLSYMTRLAVGPAWSRLSDEQRKQVSDAFARYITATYADYFASYSGEKFVVTGQQNGSYGTIVQSQIVKPSGEPISMNYLMRQNNGDWQIADIYLTGTISQMATLRSQFSSVLARDRIASLITLLNSKAQTLTASPASITRPPVCSPQSAQWPL